MIKAIRAYIPLYCNCMRFHNAILILYCKPLISLYILCICILAINIIDIDNPIVLCILKYICQITAALYRF
jgi:hypothetical protein